MTLATQALSLPWSGFFFVHINAFDKPSVLYSNVAPIIIYQPGISCALSILIIDEEALVEEGTLAISTDNAIEASSNISFKLAVEVGLVVWIPNFMQLR